MSAYKEIIKPAVVLTVVCIFVVAILAATYQVTEPVIAKVAKERADEARREILPEADEFVELTEITKNDGIKEIYAANNGEGVVITSSDAGFGGEIIFMISFDLQGKIVGVKMTEHTETPGLGTLVGEVEHTSKYIGEETTENVAVITGATISSDAMKRAIDKAIEQFGDLKGVIWSE